MARSVLIPALSLLATITVTGVLPISVKSYKLSAELSSRLEKAVKVEVPDASADEKEIERNAPDLQNNHVLYNGAKVMELDDDYGDDEVITAFIYTRKLYSEVKYDIAESISIDGAIYGIYIKRNASGALTKKSRSTCKYSSEGNILDSRYVELLFLRTPYDLRLFEDTLAGNIEDYTGYGVNYREPDIFDKARIQSEPDHIHVIIEAKAHQNPNIFNDTAYYTSLGFHTVSLYDENGSKLHISPVNRNLNADFVDGSNQFVNLPSDYFKYEIWLGHDVIVTADDIAAILRWKLAKEISIYGNGQIAIELSAHIGQLRQINIDQLTLTLQNDTYTQLNATVFLESLKYLRYANFILYSSPSQEEFDTFAGRQEPTDRFTREVNGNRLSFVRKNLERAEDEIRSVRNFTRSSFDTYVFYDVDKRPLDALVKGVSCGLE